MLRNPVLVLALLLTGCATYDTSSVPEGQLATLSFEQKAPSIFSKGSVALTRIDGKSPSHANLLFRYRGPIRIAPGKHTLQLSYMVAGVGSGSTELWFVAAPAASYNVRGDAVGDRFRLWIEEAQTGRTVGGQVGSADEPR